MTGPVQMTQIGERKTLAFWPNLLVTIDDGPPVGGTMAGPETQQPGRIVVRPESSAYGQAVLLALDIRPVELAFGDDRGGPDPSDCRVVELSGRNYILSGRDFGRLESLGVRFMTFANRDGRIALVPVNGPPEVGAVAGLGWAG